MYQIEVIHGDLTTQAVDAIVNAANTWLQGGGGVDEAIHRAAGPVINQECERYVRKHGPLPAGQVMCTTGGQLPVRGILHAVGPIYPDHAPREADRLLGACYENALLLAEQLGYHSVAFPNISTGVYGYPKDRAAKVVLMKLKALQDREWHSLQRVILVCYDQENYSLYQKMIA